MTRTSLLPTLNEHMSSPPVLVGFVLLIILVFLCCPVMRLTKTKQKHNKIFIGHKYTQVSTNNINKTWARIQTTGGKEEPNIVFRRVDMSLPSGTLSWLGANQFLPLHLNTVSLIWPDCGQRGKRSIYIYTKCIYRFSFSCSWVTIFLHSRELNMCYLTFINTSRIITAF
jgi:hypothetical protein